MVACTCNPSTWDEEEEDETFKVNLGYQKPGLKQNKTKNPATSQLCRWDTLSPHLCLGRLLCSERQAAVSAAGSVAFCFLLCCCDFCTPSSFQAIEQCVSSDKRCQRQKTARQTGCTHRP